MAFQDLELERGGGVSVWRQIEQTLAHEISSNTFGEDGRLPSEGELAKRFNVNRGLLVFSAISDGTKS